jgi:hypothetical protein
MDAFVRRLVEHLVAEGQPLSRNRHFHTFETPEGRTALRTARRLRALRRAILRAAEEGGQVELLEGESGGQLERSELRISSPVGTHRAFLSKDEWALLLGLPGLAEALEAAAPGATG